MSDLTMMHHLAPVYDTGFLPVVDGHKVWYCQAGNPKGIPVVLIHGGPGFYSRSETRTLFDPTRYRIIQFDQRGCGQSRPLGKLASNTTSDLILDIERLREYLKIQDWFIYGSSWGSTLALLVAQAYPELVKGLILKGVWLARYDDIYDLEVQATKMYFPEIYTVLIEYLQKYSLEFGPSFYSHLLKQLDSNIPEAISEAQALLESWSGNLLSIFNRVQIHPQFEFDKLLLSHQQV